MKQINIQTRDKYSKITIPPKNYKKVEPKTKTYILYLVKLSVKGYIPISHNVNKNTPLTV